MLFTHGAPGFLILQGQFGKGKEQALNSEPGHLNELTGEEGLAGLRRDTA